MNFFKSKNIISHITFYSFGQIIALSAGFISMPILTRILSKEEYGLMSLVFQTLTFFSIIASCGFPQAITRLYPEYIKKNDQEIVKRFCTTVLLSAMATSFFIILILLFLSFFSKKIGYTEKFEYYIRYASILIIFRIIYSIFLEILRAEKRSFLYNFFLIINKYMSALICIILVYYIYKGVKGVFVGTVLIEFLIVAFCSTIMINERKIGLVAISRKIFKETIRYGAPLTFGASMSFFIASGDRFVIQYFLGSEAVAAYSVPYAVSELAGTLFVTPIRLALVPFIITLFANNDILNAKSHVNNSIKYTIIIIIPIIIGSYAIADEAITILASSKYKESGGLMPYILGGELLCSIQFLFYIGIIIQKKSFSFAYLSLTGAVLNLILNAILIPVYGLHGAAYTTFATYLFVVFITHKISAKYFRISIPWLPILKSGISSILMLIIIFSIGEVSDKLILNVVAKISIGIIVYFVIFFIFEKKTGLEIIHSIKQIFLKLETK